MPNRRSHTPARLALPALGLPEVFTAGWFPLDDTGHEVTYLSTRHHALHLHEYAASMKLGSRTLAIKPGDLTFSPADVPSSYDLTQSGRHLCIHFRHMLATVSSRASPSKAGSVTVLRLPLHLSLGPARAAIAQQILHVADTHAQSLRRGDAISPLAKLATSFAMQQLLIGLAMLASRLSDRRTGLPSRTSAARSEQAVAAVAAIVRERLAQVLTVPQLADEVGLTQSYLARRFRERSGLTIPRYLLLQRVEHARFLLASTDMPVHRVGQRVGMADPQHFNKQFRRLVGVSPSLFRSSSHAAKIGVFPVELRRS
jgi:AraC-like DNA-binding protein